MVIDLVTDHRNWGNITKGSPERLIDLTYGAMVGQILIWPAVISFDSSVKLHTWKICQCQRVVFHGIPAEAINVMRMGP